MAKDFGRVVKEFEPLRESPMISLRIRVLEQKSKKGEKERRLDIRQFIKKEQEGDFEGFTKKGITLSGEEFENLTAILADITQEMFP